MVKTRSKQSKIELFGARVVQGRFGAFLVHPCAGLRRLGLSFTPVGLGFALAGLGSTLAGLGFTLAGLGFTLARLGFALAGLGFTLAGLGFTLAGLGSTLAGLPYEILAPKLRSPVRWASHLQGWAPYF